MKAHILGLSLLVVGALSSFTYISHESAPSTDSETIQENPGEFSQILKRQLKHLHHLDPIDISQVPSIYPLIASELTQTASPFGMRNHPIFKINKMHQGQDFAAPIGTPVIATADGFVAKTVLSKDFGGYGRHLMIEHDEVFKEEDYQTLYAHLSELWVREGQRVARGDTIGLTGNSGTSTAPHLHYEVIRNGERVNPVDYLM